MDEFKKQIDAMTIKQKLDLILKLLKDLRFTRIKLEEKKGKYHVRFR